MRKDILRWSSAAISAFLLSACAGSINSTAPSGGNLTESLDREFNQKKQDMLSDAKKCKSIVTGAARFYDDDIIVSKSGFVNFAEPLFEEWWDMSKNKSMQCHPGQLLGLMTREDIDAQPIPLNKPIAVKGTCTKKGFFGTESEVFYKDSIVVQFVEVPGKIRILSKRREYPDCILGPVFVDERGLWQWSDQIVKNMDVIKKLPVCKPDSSSGEEKSICVNP